MKDLNFKKINDIAYADEDVVAKELLEYLKPEYKNRLKNIKDRAADIVTNARKSVGIIPLLRHNTLIGVFSCFSQQSNRFVSGSGTEFMQRLGDIIAIA